MTAPSVGTKAALRRELRARRRGLSVMEHRRRSLAAARILARLPQFGFGRRVALTLSFDREIDTRPLIAAARRRGVRLYTPVVVDKRRRLIRFYPLTAATRRGTFGIQVPTRTSRPLGSRWFDLVVVPLVGIDLNGRRLGMGGGFYDGAMAFRRRRLHWRGPRLLGHAFDCQRVATVHAEFWDLTLDALATESGLHLFFRGPT